MKKGLIIISLILVAAMAFASGNAEAGSSSSTSQETTFVKGGTMTIATNQQFNSMFNPYQAGNAVDWGWPCLETLGFQYPGQGWQLLLADSFDVDASSGLVTIGVKKGIKFHNGDTLDAEDVAFSIQAWVDYGRGATIGNPSSVTVKDEYTVEVKYDVFSLNIQDWLLTAFIFSKTAFEENGLDWMLTHMVGTGPYKMVGFTPDVSIEYERWDGYRDEYTKGPEKIKVLYITEETTTLAAFLSGDVTFFKTTSAETVQQLNAYGFNPETMVGGTEFVHYAIPMTVVDGDPLCKKEVRQAIYLYGIDWDAYAYALLGDMGYHTDSIGAAGCPYYDESL